MSRARVRWIAGPVLRAESDGPFTLREAVRVGPAGLLGEVVRLDGAEILVQVYEDTAGLRPGTEVVGDGRPLSIRVGPGLLGRIFDGLLRPLVIGDTPWMKAGIAESDGRTFEFLPEVKEGDVLAAGARLGRVRTEGAREQSAMLPPNVSGTVTWLREDGRCRDDETVCRVRDAEGEEHEVALAHPWPVRVPRPVKERLPSRVPLVTGQRVLDSLFPIALGGKAAIPGGFGTGKTVLLEALAKGCRADVIIYLGCGERGNEMAGVLEEFPRLEDPRTGRALMERTVVIANTSNMPVAAREASIYCAITVAEYFRDQGLDVALMADSTSRWAEALREVSGRFGELPGEGGYPAYLSSRLAEFYERAARVRTLAGDEGSVTVMGAISPPSGDFSEPVTSHTKRYVRSFWALDVRRAQARFYPAVNPLTSYAEDAAEFAPWWSEQGATRWLELRRRFLTLLEDQSRLERMARIIGKDALPARQQLTLLAADLVNEAFLRQSAFSPIDRVASPERQSAMMERVARFIELAEGAVGQGVAPARIQAMACWRPLVRMGEEIGEDHPEAFAALDAAMASEFHALSRETEEAHAAETAG